MLAVFCGILAGIVQLAGYWKYNQLLSREKIVPNTTTWALWGFGGVVEYIIYGDLVRDWAKEFLPLMCALAVFATFIHVLWRRSSAHPDYIDLGFFFLDVLIVMFWVFSKNPFVSNALLGIDILLSNLPILRSTWKDPPTENWKPWAIWSVAYGLLITVVVLRWETWWELIYPTLYLILHATMWAIVRFRTAGR